MNCLSCTHRKITIDDAFGTICEKCHKFSMHSSLVKGVYPETSKKPNIACVGEVPSHYISNGVEVRKVLLAFDLHKNAPRSDAIEYLFRADRKGTKVEDLKKAISSIKYEIALIEEGKL